MSETQPKKLNLMDFLFKKVKLFAKKDTLFTKVCHEILTIKKAQYIPNDDWFKEKLYNKDMQEMVLQFVVNEALDWSRREAEKNSLQQLTGFFLPAIDNISGSSRFNNLKVSGVVLPFITLEGQIIGLIKWNQSPFVYLGQDKDLKDEEKAKIPIPYFYLCQIDILYTESKSKGQIPKTFKSYTLKYINWVDPSQPIKPEELQAALLANSKNLNDIAFDDAYQLVILRNVSLNSITPLEYWYKTGNKTKSKFTENGIEKEIEVDELTEMVEGQELLQEKYGTESDPVLIPCFRFTTFNVLNKIGTSIYYDVFNHQFGSPTIWLPAWKSMIQSSQSFGNLSKPNSDEMDPFKHLTNTYRSTEMIVVGKITYLKKKKRDDNFFSGSMNVAFITDLRFPAFDESDRHINQLVFPTLTKPQTDLLIKKVQFDREAFLKQFVIPKDVDINLTGQIEITDSSVEQPPLSETEQDYDYQIQQAQAEEKAKSLPKAPPQITHPGFKAFLHHWTQQFRDSGNKIEEENIDGELLLVLSSTMNVWSPDPPYWEMADPDAGIIADDEGVLFDYWTNHVAEKKEDQSKEPEAEEEKTIDAEIVDETGEDQLPVPKDGVISENQIVIDEEKSQHLTVNIDEKVTVKDGLETELKEFESEQVDGGVPDTPETNALNHDLGEINPKDLYDIFENYAMMSQEEIEEFISEQLQSKFDPAMLDGWLSKMVRDGDISLVDDKYVSNILHGKKVKPASDSNSELSTLVGVRDREVLEKQFMKDLKELAKTIGCKNYSKLKKEDLINLILKQYETEEQKLNMDMNPEDSLSGTENLPAPLTETDIQEKGISQVVPITENKKIKKKITPSYVVRGTCQSCKRMKEISGETGACQECDENSARGWIWNDAKKTYVDSKEIASQLLTKSNTGQNPNFTEKENADIEELKNIIHDILLVDSTLTADTLFENYGDTLPASINIGYKIPAQKIIDQFRSNKKK